MKVLLIALVLCACGSDDSNSEIDNANSYPDADKAAFLGSCKAEALKAAPTAQGVDGYCLCTLQEIMHRYDYEEFNASPYSVIKEIEDDGTVTQCIKENIR
jgi:hypothetical protein